MQEKNQKSVGMLDELVPLYYDANTQAKHFKDSATQLGEQIKSICLTNGELKGEFGEYKYSVSTQLRQSLDEEVLLECVKKLPKKVAQSLIKVKEYVDESALEKALFTGVIKPEDVSAAQITKEVVALRVTKGK